MAGFQFVSPDIAVDIGTNNTRVYVRDRGIVVNESSVVIARGDGARNIVAVGDSAEEMIGRSAGDIRIIHPLRDGVIVDYEMAQIMIHYFISKAIGTRRFVRPRVVVTMPGEVSKVERRAVINAMEKIGARQIFVVEQAFAAALGTGLPVYEPQGSFVVDIGGGTTEVAVISLAGIVYSRSVRVGGDKMDEAIMTHVKRKYNMLIGESSAEEIKIKIASAYPLDPEQQLEVKGRDLVTGIPQNIIITSEEVRKAISEQVDSIVQAVRIALEQTPPELAADIVDRGIVLTGGGALLKGLDQLLREETSLPITVVDDPLSTVVVGTGKALDNLGVLKEVCID